MFDKDPFKDPFFARHNERMTEFDKQNKTMQNRFWAAWWVITLVGIVFAGATIWALVRVILKYT